MRRRLDSAFPPPEIDLTDEQLAAQISQSSDDERTFLTRLRRDYWRFQNAPSHEVGTRIFQSWMFQGDLAVGGVQGNDLHSQDSKFALLTDLAWKSRQLFIQSRSKFLRLYVSFITVLTFALFQWLTFAVRSLFSTFIVILVLNYLGCCPLIPPQTGIPNSSLLATE